MRGVFERPLPATTDIRPGEFAACARALSGGGGSVQFLIDYSEPAFKLANPQPARHCLQRAQHRTCIAIHAKPWGVRRGAATQPCLSAPKSARCHHVSGWVRHGDWFGKQAVLSEMPPLAGRPAGAL
jgi:hypothetical protein